MRLGLYRLGLKSLKSRIFQGLEYFQGYGPRVKEYG